MKKYLILSIAIAFLSCSKEEGYGGMATIHGKVFARDFNSDGNLVSEGYMGDVKVYISKSGTTDYFDKLDTAYDGSFTFDYLHEGKYDIWAYGDCDTCAWDQTFVLQTVSIVKPREKVTCEDLVITF